MSDKPYTPRIDLSVFNGACRLLISVPLKVADGTNGRFQPTGFPDLGPALYKGVREFEEVDKSGKKQKVLRHVNMLFSDTAAALANWMEAVCLSGDDYNDDCRGIPYVRVLDGDAAKDTKPFLTSSVREPHRLASPYVLASKGCDSISKVESTTSAPAKPVEGGMQTPASVSDLRRGPVKDETVKAWLGKQLEVNKQRPVRPWVLAQRLFEIDPGCILHGVFLEELDGRLRLPRLVSGYIEAANPQTVNYGGVYRGEVTAKDNIPFSKQEFTSDDIRASFIVHLSTLQGHALDETSTKKAKASLNETNPKQAFLILWALYKIDRFLMSCLRLRSGCEFEADGITATLDRGNWPWPKSDDIRADFNAAKANCFPEPANNTNATARQRTIEVTWTEPIPPTVMALTEGITVEMIRLEGFEGRVEAVNEREFKTGKGKDKKTEKKPALVIRGIWENKENDYEELSELLKLNPEKIPDGEGEKDNPVNVVVKSAVSAHRAKLKERDKKQATKENGEE